MQLVGQRPVAAAALAPSAARRRATDRLRRQLGLRLAVAALSFGASVTASLALAVLLRLAGR